MPPGLTCALGTGVISGTPLAGGTYVATLVAHPQRAMNASATLTITIPISTSSCSRSPSNLVMTSAKLKGSVTSLWWTRCNYYRLRGDNNANTNVGKRDSNADLGSKGQVALAHDITGLLEVRLIITHLKVLMRSVEQVVQDGLLCKVLQHQHLSVLLFLEIYTPLQILHPPQQS